MGSRPSSTIRKKSVPKKDKVRIIQDPLMFFVLKRIIEVQACGHEEVDFDILKEHIYKKLVAGTKFENTKFIDRFPVDVKAKSKVKTTLKYLSESYNLFFSNNKMDGLVELTGLNWLELNDGDPIVAQLLEMVTKVKHPSNQWYQFCRYFNVSTVTIFPSYTSREISVLDSDVLFSIKEYAIQLADSFLENQSRTHTDFGMKILEDTNYYVRMFASDKFTRFDESGFKDHHPELFDLRLICYNRFNQPCGRITIVPLIDDFINKLLTKEHSVFEIAESDIFKPITIREPCQHFYLSELSFQGGCSYLMEMAIFRALSISNMDWADSKAWILNEGREGSILIKKYPFTKKASCSFNNGIVDLLSIQVYPDYYEHCLVFNGDASSGKIRTEKLIDPNL